MGRGPTAMSCSTELKIPVLSTTTYALGIGYQVFLFSDQAIIGLYEKGNIDFTVYGVLDLNTVYIPGYSNTIKIDLVRVAEKERKYRLGTTLYLTLLYNGYTIVSDSIQFDNARRLWRTLSNNFPGISVDVIDSNTNTVLKSSHHIQNVDIPDLDLEWSYGSDISKKHIRFIAYKK